MIIHKLRNKFYRKRHISNSFKRDEYFYAATKFLKVKSVNRKLVKKFDQSNIFQAVLFTFLGSFIEPRLPCSSCYCENKLNNSLLLKHETPKDID